MPYSNAWDEALPTGLTARDQVDDLFRQLKLDLRERLESALVIDVDADPWVILASISGQQTGKKLFLPWSAANFGDNDHTEFNVIDQRLRDTTSTSQYYFPVVLQQGAVITNIKVYCEPANTTVTAWLKSTELAGGTVAVEAGPFTATGVVYTNADSGSISVTIGPKFYNVRVELAPTGPDQPALYGVVITYDAADSRVTI